MSDLWTAAELKHYHRTGEEPGAQPAGEKKPKRPAKAPEAPLSVDAARAICKVKSALARDAKAAADVAWAEYDALSEAKDGEDEG